MTRPPVVSPHFAAVALDGAFNARRGELPAPLRTPAPFAERWADQAIRGMPFAFGERGEADVVLLDAEAVSIELGGALATYVLFVHVAEDVGAEHLGRSFGGDELGELVSEYELEHEDGTTSTAPVLRRFAIQQARCQWGSTPFACVPAAQHHVLRPAEEEQALGRALAADVPVERGATRAQSVADLALAAPDFLTDLLWIYALANPQPDRPLRRVTCRPREARSAIYAVTTTSVGEHPLRPGVRRKLRLRVPDGMEPNAIGELEGAEIDLGTVISARGALDYDDERWRGDDPLAEPVRSEREVIVEYAAHPQARLHVGERVVELGDDPPGEAVATVAPAQRPVRLRFREAASGEPVAVRLHLHGEAGEYLPPRGHHRKTMTSLFSDRAAEFVNGDSQHAYVDGTCVADLPLGTVYVEISRGCEIAPVRTSIEVTPETDEVEFALERVLRWRERGWVTADTHVHFLSPQTALLEGRAEGVNVVNVLATQWGEAFTNVGDFDGRTTFGAEDLGGRGEFLVRVGSENRMPALGHISLLGYSGELIHPLCSGGPSESAFGDPLEVTMAEWAQRCIDQRGLVVMPHAPKPQLERAADVVLGLVHAMEMMRFNPLCENGFDNWLAYGVADWYRYLNLGYHLPLVGGSDKMTAAMLLGGMRTYAHLGERELTYESWMDAIRAGNTFATVGPLASLHVEGVAPGGRIELPAGGGRVQVAWEVESVRVPIERVEVVAGGLVVEDASFDGVLAASGHAAVAVPHSTWIALRVRGSYHRTADEIAAHTSAVQVLVDGSELFAEADAMAVLDQIQGALAYVDTVAPRAEARRFEQLRATLSGAYHRLHQRMHAAGVYHRHPLHDPAHPHEH